MCDFYCGQCGYTTTSKSSMDRHRARKTPCKPAAPSPSPSPQPTVKEEKRTDNLPPK